MKRLLYGAALFLLLTSGCRETKESESNENEAVVLPPSQIPFSIVNILPHDTSAFTQGLVWYNNQLLEGTGQLGASNIRKVDLASGKVLAQKNNDPEIFGEGITVMNGLIYQVSWQNKKAFTYRVENLDKTGEFTLDYEGWGLTNNGTDLILSDGSSQLYFIDPQTFKERRRVSVYDHLGPKGNLNELEYISGHVYANVWQTDVVVKIDPATGKITGQLELGTLRSQGNIPPSGTSATAPEVLNGIAWDSAGNRIFVTGKYWPKLFELRLNP